MTTRVRTALLAAALLAWSAGCASDKIQVTRSFDPVASFPEQATYSWNDAANKLPQDDRLRELDLDSLIRQAADEAFAARGYRRVDGPAGDFRLSYQLSENIWRGPEGMTSVASISLVLTTAKSGHRVWVGFGRADVEPAISREQRAERLREAFDEMLEDFPPSNS